MADIQTTGWGSRLAKSIVGALVGVVIFIVAFPLLIWNEYNSVQTIRALEEGAGQCVTVPDEKIEAANDTHLVHTTGEATTTETLKDDQFGVSVVALKITRTPEIYQYVERSESTTEKRTGGKEVTITKYYHDKKWVENPVPSANFNEDEITHKFYVNVGSLPYTKGDKHAKDPKLGAYKLTDGQVDKMDELVPAGDKAFPVTTEMLAAVPPGLKDHDKLTVSDGYFYLPYKAKTGKVPPKEGATSPEDDPKDVEDDATGPQIGDVRVSFTAVKPQKISVIAMQDNGKLSPWKSSNGKEINDLRLGVQTKEQMFETLQGENSARTWLIRLVGFALMAGGIFLVGKPIVVFGDFFPMLGSFVQVLLGVFAVILALPLTLITIALAWVVVRPLIAIPILVTGVLLFGVAIWFIVSRRRKSSAGVAAAR